MSKIFETHSFDGQYCENCYYSKSAIIHYNLQNCQLIAEISNTHTWEIVKQYPDGTETYICDICLALGYKAKKNIIQSLSLVMYDQIYSCNEGLMIRANK